MVEVTPELEALRKQLDEAGIKYHHLAGVEKLKELLTAKETVVPGGNPDTEKKPESVEGETTREFSHEGKVYRKTYNAKGDSIKVELIS